MHDLALRLWGWLHTPQGKKLFRYTMTSVISTAVSLIVLAIVFGVLRLWSEVPSTVFANVVAAFPSYWLNRTWAWGKTGRSHLVKEVLPFWVMSLTSIAFSIVGASAARFLGRTWHLQHVEQTILVLAANVVSFGVFWVLKLVVFNHTFRVPTLLEEIDERVHAEESGVGSATLGTGERAGIR